MAEAVAPQVFTRRASGLVRVMSPYSAFIYNILTMGIIFPWVFMQAPTAFQGSNLVLAIVFGFFVVWILQWVALSGWLLASVGIAPMFIGLGVTTGVSAFTDFGTWAAGANGIIIISVLNE